jgi:hypothetical protein
MEMGDNVSITSEEFENVYIPRLNAISTILNVTPEAIPDEFDQYELMNTMTQLTTELRNSINSRVPEIESRNKKIASLEDSLKKTQDTNQKLNILVAQQTSREVERSRNNDNDTKEKKLLDFKQIDKIFQNL